MDPYCKIEYETNAVLKTHTKNDAGKTPVWNDEFTFRADSEKEIKLTVLDDDPLSDDVCGVYKGPIKMLIGENPQKDKLHEVELELKAGEQIAGKLFVGTFFE